MSTKSCKIGIDFLLIQKIKLTNSYNSSIIIVLKGVDHLLEEAVIFTNPM